MQVEVLSSRSHEVGLYEVSNLDDAKKFYLPINGVRFNYVVSARDSAQSDSSAISNEADRLFLRAIRSFADLIITTGKTARDEKLKGSSLAPLMIITNAEQLNVPATQEFSEQKVYVTNRQEDLGNPNAEAIGHLDTDLVSFTKDLLHRHERIVLEVGLSTALLYSRAGMIDEVCLTVTYASESSSIDALNEFLEELEFGGSVIQRIRFETTWFFRIELRRF